MLFLFHISFYLKYNDQRKEAYSMNYYVHNIETSNARIFKKKHYQFDYIEPASFEKMQNSNSLSVIGCIKLKKN